MTSLFPFARFVLYMSHRGVSQTTIDKMILCVVSGRSKKSVFIQQFGEADTNHYESFIRWMVEVQQRELALAKLASSNNVRVTDVLMAVDALGVLAQHEV